MNEVANRLAQSLFKKNNLQECSRWELEILADKYPYFGIAQLLLAGKLHEENNEAYQKQIQKTSLYFTNPLWLDYTLNEQRGKEAKQTEEPQTTNVFEKQKQFTPEELRFAPAANDINIEQETPIVEPEIIQPSSTEIVEETVDVASKAEEITRSAMAEETHQVEERFEEPVNSTSNTEEPVELKIAPLKMEPAPDANAPLVFEALHTVDYFASQGIKLKLDEIPKDKFGQQLKSFTEWLKTLKKAPPTEISKNIDKGTEQKVINLAEHSLENRDVLTEAMAEVWAKQGNKAKAIEVYEKLSLQIPAKSSYFAALIEQLKQS